MGGAGGIKPLVAVNLVIAYHPAHAIMEYLRSASRQRIDTGGLQLLQSLSNRELGSLCQESHFHHGEGFQMNLGKALLEPGDQIEEILKRQIGMESTHNVEFGNGF